MTCKYYGCSNLISITIPNSVTSIGQQAFSGCTGLTSVTIPNSVTSIESYAFSGCSSLTSITIPNSVTSIGGGTFANCSGLTSVTIPNSVTSIWGDRRYQGCFEGCSSLVSVIIPNSVTSIGPRTFSGCSSLTTITIPNSVTIIEQQTFKGCSSLTSVTIPNTITIIGQQTFEGCLNLASIAIPESVTSIEKQAFSGCTNLTSVHITNLVSWSNIKFDMYEANPLYYAGHLYLNGKEVNNLVVPNGATGIGAYSFYNCKSIASVKIPNTVKSIEPSAFYGCSNLTSITISESVTSIGGAAFDGAKFRNIVIKTKTPPSGNSAFSDQTYYHTTLMIPEGCWDAYAYSDDIWYKFINIREMVDNTVNLTNSKAYTMKSATEGAYLFYDSVNDCVGTLNETAFDDTEENNTWMTVEVDGKNYVYNLGAKKFLVPDKTNKTGYSLSDTPVSIDIEDGKDAIVFGKGKEFYMVINDKLIVDENLESQIIATTGIKGISVEANKQTVNYNVNGQIVPDNTKGLHIRNGKKVVVK